MAGEEKLITLDALSLALPSWIKRNTKPSYTADDISTTGTTNQFVTANEKNTWDGKYALPSGGVPKTDLASAVQTSLDKAESAVQTETDPTVPSWAKQQNPPTYTSDDISDTNQTHKFATAEQLQQISTNQTNILSISTELATKGTYSKPSGGIPKTDLASSVQTSLDKADTALQSETYTGTVTQVKVGSTSYDPSSGVVSLPAYPDTSGKIDTAGTGLSKSGTTLNHSNSVSEVTTAGAYKVKYDAQGHITGTASLSASDISAVPTSRTVNSLPLSSDITLTGNNVYLTSYSKGSSTAAVSSSDKVNAAFAKHENRLNALDTTIGNINTVLEGVL